MTVRRAATAYRDRIAAVVDAILQDPTRNHRLEDLAAIAHFSPFHFHRVYQGVTGETVAATIRRIRLAQATQLLGRVNQSVTQVALEVGYESPQAFTRAFRQFSGESPRGFRTKTRAAGDLCRTGGKIRRSLHIRSSASSNARPCGSMHCATEAPRPRSPTPTDACSSTWASAKPCNGWASHSATLQPMSTSPIAAADLPAAGPKDPEIEALEIPAGSYAVHRLDGPYSQINAAIGALYSLWLPQSGYEPDDRPTLEHYLNSPQTAEGGALRTDLLIPIRALR
ncbi:AraC family transcriptional regulator [Variovorax ginsengisoli]|uniref:AraC family transcriptional regulator n=1 Tax=Variovorax ginsengisoli TaxID=363844 RepID=A0ABT8RWX0_9BURK|nr:AraC family transcriptional regulator [Variovorax ginsengisoli]MDN8611966.1 AraC family transcriptional regulator [Variovorax ginsengisoli]MDO1531136.1 AraC family transcriptional regulator [Variovorax ginsengisoli]